MKYYLCALLLCGAFFSHSQDVELPEYHCPSGGSLELYSGSYICRTGLGPAGYEANLGGIFKAYGSTANEAAQNVCQVYIAAGTEGGPTVRRWREHITPDFPWQCKFYSVTQYYDTITQTWSQPARTVSIVSPSTNQTSGSCPPDNQPDFTNLGGTAPNQFCWKQAESIPPDEEPPPECDDIVGNCQPDPECVQGGGGMTVCKADPDEKCWQDAFGQTQCEEGCGFVNQDFFCATEPTDNPDFAKCKFAFNGYACPSEPDDDITEPEKPLDQMTKQDFKQTNIGVESRLNLTNDLLETQLAADERNAGEITGSINNMNQNLGGKLDTINGTLGGIGEGIESINNSLNPEQTREIGEPESWYEPVYEDGISGVWDSHRAALDQTPLFTFLDQFKFAPSGTQPDWNICFNLGALGNYGCERLEVPSFIWNFIRIVMLLGAAFTARRLVFGG